VAGVVGLGERGMVWHLGERLSTQEGGKRTQRLYSFCKLITKPPDFEIWGHQNQKLTNLDVRVEI